MTVTLADLLKDSDYRLDQFKPEHIAALEAGITLKEVGKSAAPYVNAWCAAIGSGSPAGSPSPRIGQARSRGRHRRE